MEIKKESKITITLTEKEVEKLRQELMSFNLYGHDLCLGLRNL